MSTSEANYEAKCHDISYLLAHLAQLVTLCARFYRVLYRSQLCNNQSWTANCLKSSVSHDY